MESTAFNKALFRWLAGLQEELDFWNYWAKSHGEPNPEHHALRTNPGTPIQDRVVSHGRSLGLNDVAVLDVGSGPLTKVGHQSPEDIQITVYTCDPLAPAYIKAFSEQGIKIPNPPTFALAEYLSAFYPPASMDIITCNNALDHVIDPIRAINEMLRVVKVGGILLCSHRRNEGQKASYTGLHQFNIDTEAGQAILWNPLGKVSIADQLAIATQTKIISEDSDWVHFSITKLAEFSDGNRGEHTRQQLQELLLGLVNNGLGQQQQEMANPGHGAPPQREKKLKRVLNWLRGS